MAGNITANAAIPTVASPTGRKMARLVRVDGITPIEGADRIVAAHVGGWVCVVGKGDFEPGDKAVYFEIDTFLPAADERYASFAERGVKKMTVGDAVMEGVVIRTMRLRGVYSQGLLMRPDTVGIDAETHEVGDDVTREAGVWEYEPIDLNPGSIGHWDDALAPCAGAMRIQNCGEVWDILRKVETRASIKVDGTSMGIVNDDRENARRNGIRLFGHRLEFPADETNEGYKAAKAAGLVGFVEANPGLMVQFEFAGPKINSNRQHLKGFRAFPFAVWDIRTREQVPFQNVGRFPGAAWDALRDAAAPVLEGIEWELGSYDTIEDVVGKVDGIRGNVTKDALDEGVVWHVLGRGEVPDDEWAGAKAKLMNVLGSTLEAKCISNKYLVKHKV